MGNQDTVVLNFNKVTEKNLMGMWQLLEVALNLNFILYLEF